MKLNECLIIRMIEFLWLFFGSKSFTLTLQMMRPLFLSLFLVFALYASAQTIPAPVRPHWDQAPKNVKRLFEAASGAVSSVRATEATPGPDSTLTFYGYFGNDSTPLFRTRFEHPAGGGKTQREYEFINGEWVPTYKIEFTFDQLGRNTEALSSVYDSASASFIFDAKLVNYPRAQSDSLLDSVFTYIWDRNTSQWSMILANRNTYDAQERLVQAFALFEVNGVWLDFVDVYSYDSNGDNHQVDQFARLGSLLAPVGRIEKEYVNHYVTEAVALAFDGAGFAPASKNTLGYTPDWLVDTVTSYEYDVTASQWMLTQQIRYTYFPDGAKSSETHMFLEEGEQYLDSTAYTYTMEGALSTETLHIKIPDLGDWFLETKTIYYYPENATNIPDLHTPVANLRVYPNPATERIYLDLDQEAQVSIVNLHGQQVFSGLLRPGVALDIRSLPSGVYVVRAVQGEKVFGARLVK